METKSQSIVRRGRGGYGFRGGRTSSLMVPLKRSRGYDYSSDSDIESRLDVSKNLDNAWPRYLVVKRKEGEGFPSNPFLISKLIENVSKTITNVKRLRDGSLLVECPSKKVSDSFLGRERLGDFGVEVAVHRQLNSCKGVVRCFEWRDLDCLELKNELASSGVIEVDQIKIKRDGQLVKTSTFVLTFSTHQLPKEVKLGMFLVRVTPYIPNPMRCFNCQRFGHRSSGCKSQPMCRYCGNHKHEGDCSPVKNCTNCNGSHSPSSFDCPIFKEEKEIQRIMVEQKLTYTAAKKKFIPQTNNGFSFSKVVSGQSAPDHCNGECGKVIRSLTDQITKLNALVGDLTAKVALLESKPIVEKSSTQVSLETPKVSPKHVQVSSNPSQASSNPSQASAKPPQSSSQTEIQKDTPSGSSVGNSQVSSQNKRENTDKSKTVIKTTANSARTAVTSTSKTIKSSKSNSSDIPLKNSYEALSKEDLKEKMET